jgi:hypothetical protein
MLNQELRHSMTGLHLFNVFLINRLHLTAHDFLLSMFFVALLDLVAGGFAPYIPLG